MNTHPHHNKHSVHLKTQISALLIASIDGFSIALALLPSTRTRPRASAPLIVMAKAKKASKKAPSTSKGFGSQPDPLLYLRAYFLVRQNLCEIGWVHAHTHRCDADNNGKVQIEPRSRTRRVHAGAVGAIVLVYALRLVLAFARHCQRISFLELKINLP